MANYNIVLTATDAGFTSTLKRAETEMILLNNQAIAVSATFSALRIGLMAGAASLAAMILPMSFAIKSVGDFDANLRRAASIETTFQGQNEELTDTLNDMAIQYGISANELSSGVVEFARAGFDYNTTMNKLFIPTTKLAIANMTDFETTSRVATYTWSLFNGQISDATELLNKLNIASNISLLNVEEMGSAIEYSGSSAVVAGVQYEQYLAALAALSNLAVKSQQNFGTLISRIMVSGDELENILGASGIVEDGVVNLSRLMEILEETTLSEEQVTKLGELWGIRSSRIFFTMLKASHSYSAALAEIVANQNTLDRQANAMADSIPAMWERIKSALTAPLRSPQVLDKFNQALSKLLQAIQGGQLANLIADIVEMSANFITGFGGGLIDTIEHFLTVAKNMLPTIENIAKFSATAASYLSRLGSSTWLAVVAMISLNKIIPLTSAYTWMAARNIKKYVETAKENVIMNSEYIQTVGQLNQARVQESIATKFAEQTVRQYTKTLMDTVALQETSAAAEELRKSSVWGATQAQEAQTLVVQSEAQALQLLNNAKKSAEMATIQLAMVEQNFGKDAPIFVEAQKAKALALENLALTERKYSNYMREMAPFNAMLRGQELALRNLAKAENEVEAAEYRLIEAREIERAAIARGGAAEWDAQFYTKQRIKAEDELMGKIGMRDTMQQMATNTTREATSAENGLAMARKVSSADIIMEVNSLSNLDDKTKQLIISMLLEKNASDALSLSFQKQDSIEKKLAWDSVTLAQKLNMIMTTGMFALLQGIMMIVQSKDGFVRAIGLMSIAIGGLTTAYIMLANAKVLATKPLPFALAMSATMIASMVGMYAMMRAQEKQAKRDTAAMEAEASGGEVTMPTLPSSTDMETKYSGAEVTPTANTEIYSSQTGGFVQKTGWRLIHKGEYVVPEKHIATVKTATEDTILRTSINNTLNVTENKKQSDFVENVTETISRLVNSVNTEKTRRLAGRIEDIEIGENIAPVVPLIGKIVQIEEPDEYSVRLKGVLGASENATNIINEFNNYTTENIGNVLKSQTMTTEVENVVGSAKGGLVKTEGWRYIHEGEFIVPEKEVATVKKSTEPESVSTNVIQKLTDRKSSERFSEKSVDKLTERITEMSKFIQPIFSGELAKETRETRLEEKKEIYRSTVQKLPSVSYTLPLPKEILSEKSSEKTTNAFVLPLITKERTKEARERIETVGPKETYKTLVREISPLAYHVLPQEVIREKSIRENLIKEYGSEKILQSDLRKITQLTRFVTPIIAREKNEEYREFREKIGSKEVYKTLVKEFPALAYRSLPKEISIERSVVEKLVPISQKKEKEVGSAKGGFVEKTGWRLLHSGEIVVPKESVATVEKPSKIYSNMFREKSSEKIYREREMKTVTERLIEGISKSAIERTTNNQVIEREKVGAQEGGTVKKDGWVYVHDGEWIIPQNDITKVYPTETWPSGAGIPGAVVDSRTGKTTMPGNVYKMDRLITTEEYLSMTIKENTEKMSEERAQKNYMGSKGLIGNLEGLGQTVVKVGHWFENLFGIAHGPVSPEQLALRQANITESKLYLSNPAAEVSEQLPGLTALDVSEKAQIGWTEAATEGQLGGAMGYRESKNSIDTWMLESGKVNLAEEAPDWWTGQPYSYVPTTLQPATPGETVSMNKPYNYAIDKYTGENAFAVERIKPGVGGAISGNTYNSDNRTQNFYQVSEKDLDNYVDSQ